MATGSDRRRLAWERGSVGTWLTATWEGAGPHDGANIHQAGGLPIGHPTWRWQVTVGRDNRYGYAETKQLASDAANEAWWEMMGMEG